MYKACGLEVRSTVVGLSRQRIRRPVSVLNVVLWMAVAPLCMVDCFLGSRSTVLGSSSTCMCFTEGFSVVVQLFPAAVAAAGDRHAPMPARVAMGVF
jgi:hypothetical protein